MDVVTGAMREQRRARRDAERASRGAPPRRRFGPRPAGLIREGWSPVRVPAPPASASGARLLGATTPVVLIADRARVAVGAREVATGVLPLPRATVGPMPASAFSLAVASPASTSPEPEPAAVEPAPASAAVPAPASAPAPAAAPTEAPVLAAAMAMTGAPPPPAPPFTPSAPAAAPFTPAAPAAVVAAPAVAAAPEAPVAPPAPPAAPAPVPTPPSGHTSPREPLPSDKLAHALGLSPANMPAPETARSRPTRRSRPQPARYEPRRRGRLVLAAVGVIVVVGAGTAAGIAISNGSDDPGPIATSTAPAAAGSAAASWLSGNVATDRRIVSTDATLARDLNAAGVPVDTVASNDEARVGVVVVSSDAPSPAPTVTSAGTSRTLVTLALFDSGNGRVAVGQVVQGSTEEISADLDKAAETAAAACNGLSSNAAVTIDPSVAAVFEAGDLDLRASTLLALLAQSQPVEVVAAPQDDAERRVGRPVRTLVVKVQDENAVRSAAASARAPYNPEVNEPTAALDAPPGSLVLSWPTDASATLPLT